MTNTSTYYVVAPIDGIHLDFDYRMYSAEVYGCPPNYIPNPKGCSEFRQPYEYLGSFTFKQYKQLSEEWKIDHKTLHNLEQVPNRKLRDFTCIALEIELDRTDYTSVEDEAINNSLFQHIINRGEQFLDVWRLCLFKPGEDFSIGSFGAIGNGVQCFWLGKNDIAPKFIARKISRYQLVQQPVDVVLSKFGTIYADITFRSLCTAAFTYPSNPEIINRLFDALRAFRESRDISNWEARFRHLAAIAESLARKYDKERLQGKQLRERIAKISTHGWELYEHYGSSVLTPSGLQREQYKLIRKRYQEIGWNDEDEAKDIIEDLWDNVRNSLAHTVNTVTSLQRDPLKDMVNMERVIVTMINGIHTAYQVQEFYVGSIYDILIDNK
ncbi:hypothetical protein [Nostoc sp.]|uniref:hypothetical protein n=1 Tax=Nostoc sp. TaxID=1180 RepID=UPI002FF6561F